LGADGEEFEVVENFSMQEDMKYGDTKNFRNFILQIGNFCEFWEPKSAFV